MAVLWQFSLIPQIDANGDPQAGATAEFFLATTTTPMTVYHDSALSTGWAASELVTDAAGVWPAIFLPPTTYHMRLTYPDGTIRDVDGIDPPQAASYVPPSAGTTDPTLLLSTGMIMDRHGTDVLTGWVRANGRTVGNAASGATERANADTSALFTYLWNQDASLTVSTGRSGTAAGDFAANKTIELPDYRSRSRIGRGSMGNSAASLIADAQFDNSETADTIGATAGAATHALTSAEMPSHTHTATVTDPGHTHGFSDRQQVAGSGSNQTTAGANIGFTDVSRTTVSGTTGVTVANSSTGSGTAHTVVQPSVAVTTYIKL